MTRPLKKLDQPQEPDKGWLPPPSPNEILQLQEFVFQKWCERAKELHLDNPGDLSGSCKFTSLFIQSLYGGDIRGNWHHIHVRLKSGQVIDLNSKAQDVQDIITKGSNPHLHHRSFIASAETRASFESCRPRVTRWIEEWLSIAEDRIS